MINQYITCLNELEEDDLIGEDALVKKQQKVARVLWVSHPRHGPVKI